MPSVRRKSVSSPRHQPAKVGRSCVVIDSQRVGRVGVGALEAEMVRPLEREHAVAEHAGSHDGVRETGRAGAQILGDHQGLGAVALQPQHGEQRVERVFDR